MKLNANLNVNLHLSQFPDYPMGLKTAGLVYPRAGQKPLGWAVTHLTNDT